MIENHEASPKMKIFFTKLLEIKAYIRRKVDQEDNQAVAEALEIVYEKLDQIIKE